MSAAAPRRLARTATRPAPVERPRSAHLRPAPDPRRRRRVRLALVAGVIVAAGSLFVAVAFSVLIAQGQFERADLAQRQEAEQNRYEGLRLEVAERSSPEAVVSAAEALGMVVPDQVEYIEAEVPAVTDGVDRTATTLGESWEDVKASLGSTP